VIHSLQQQQQSAKSQADGRPFGLDAAGAARRLLMLAYRGTEIARAGRQGDAGCT